MSHPATARLFVALDLPRDLCEELSCWARSATRQARADERAVEAPAAARHGHGGHERRRERHRHLDRHGMRLLDAESMHLTISFLGSRPVEEIEPLTSIVESLSPPIGPSSLGAPLWLPKRRPHALAVEVHDDSGTVIELHEALAGALQAAGLAPRTPDHGAGRRRSFRAHVTVARMRADAAPRQRTLAPTPDRSFTPQRLVLYRSWLSPEGASYEPLASCATWTPAPAD